MNNGTIYNVLTYHLTDILLLVGIGEVLLEVEEVEGFLILTCLEVCYILLHHCFWRVAVA